MSKELKKYIRVQSSINIRVTGSLSVLDLTDEKALIGDKLKATPLWTSEIVHIKEGVNIYPAEIRDWPTVKALVNDGLLTITDATEKDVAKADNVKVIDDKIEQLREAEKERKAKLEALKGRAQVSKLPSGN